MKKWESNQSSPYSAPLYNAQAFSYPNLSNTNTNDNESALKDENENLRKELKVMKAENDASKEVICGLEKELVKVESVLTKNSKETKALNKALNTEIENVKVLKAVIKNHNNDATKKTNEINCAMKTIKSKEKEIHNLEKKTDNQQDTIQRLRAEKDKLKSEKIKCEKDLEKKNKKDAKKETKVQDINVSQASKCTVTNKETKEPSEDIHEICDTVENKNFDPVLKQIFLHGRFPKVGEKSATTCGARKHAWTKKWKLTIKNICKERKKRERKSVITMVSTVHLNQNENRSEYSRD